MASYSSRIEYTAETVSNSVPQSAGVYLIRVKIKDGSTEVIYVGQAKNLRRRLLEHLRSDESNECLKEHVEKYHLYCSWIEMTEQGKRDFEESAKIQKYNPECNVQHP